MLHTRSLLLGLSVAAGVLWLDQTSKAILLAANLAQEPIRVTSFFNLVMVWNHGVSFGLFSTLNQRYALIGITSLITLLLAGWLARTQNLWQATALGMVIGGATGNIIDRITLGAVADFFDFYIGSYHWPAFNIADSFIFIGVVVLCSRSMFTGDRHHT